MSHGYIPGPMETPVEYGGGLPWLVKRIVVTLALGALLVIVLVLGGF